MIANEFHTHSYQDRIIESKNAIQMIDRLRESISVTTLKNLLSLDFDPTNTHSIGYHSRPHLAEKEKDKDFRLDISEGIIPRKTNIWNHFNQKSPSAPKNEMSQDAILPQSTVPSTRPDNDHISLIKKSEPMTSQKSGFFGTDTKKLASKLNIKVAGSQEITEEVTQRIRQGVLIGGEKRLKGQTLDLLSDKTAMKLSKKIFKALSDTAYNHTITAVSFLPYVLSHLDIFKMKH